MQPRDRITGEAWLDRYEQYYYRLPWRGAKIPIRPTMAETKLPVIRGEARVRTFQLWNEKDRQELEEVLQREEAFLVEVKDMDRSPTPEGYMVYLRWRELYLAPSEYEDPGAPPVIDGLENASPIDRGEPGGVRMTGDRDKEEEDEEEADLSFVSANPDVEEVQKSEEFNAPDVKAPEEDMPPEEDEDMQYAEPVKKAPSGASRKGKIPVI